MISDIYKPKRRSLASSASVTTYAAVAFFASNALIVRVAALVIVFKIHIPLSDWFIKRAYLVLMCLL